MNQYMEFYKLLGEFYNEEDITVDSPMSEHIYFRVGGPADILVTPVNEEQVVNTLKLCREYNVPYFILGNGSNILVKDGGISGVVIKFNKLNKITTEGNCVTAQSGALLKDVSKAALENNLRRKYKVLYHEEYLDDLNIVIKDYSPIKRKSIGIKGGYIHGFSKVELIVLGNKKIQDVAYYCGLGSQNMMGAGFVSYKGGI